MEAMEGRVGRRLLCHDVDFQAAATVAMHVRAWFTQLRREDYLAVIGKFADQCEVGSELHRGGEARAGREEKSLRAEAKRVVRSSQERSHILMSVSDDISDAVLH
jgi:hypothetical protein